MSHPLARALRIVAVSALALPVVVALAAPASAGNAPVKPAAAVVACPTGVNAVNISKSEIIAPGAPRIIGQGGDLTGRVFSGDTVRVTFSVASGCANIPVSFEAYNARLALNTPATFAQFLTTQTLFDSATGRFSAGRSYTLEVTTPAARTASTGGCPAVNKGSPAGSVGRFTRLDGRVGVGSSRRG